MIFFFVDFLLDRGSYKVLLVEVVFCDSKYPGPSLLYRAQVPEGVVAGGDGEMPRADDVAEIVFVI
jgi:hypothetical protein